jgi:hypothetical protein
MRALVSRFKLPRELFTGLSAPAHFFSHHPSPKAQGHSMTKKRSHSPGWETSSFGHPAEVSPHERAALSDHLSLCAALRGPLQVLHSGFAAVQGILAGRVITAVLLVFTLVGGVWLLR